MRAGRGNKQERGQTGRDPELLRRLLRAKDRMDAASHEEWPVRRLARVSGVSQAHFARSFKQAFGVPPHRYLLTRRIERAKHLLTTTEDSVLEIALAVGFESAASFSRAFRRVVGVSPRAFRRLPAGSPPEGVPTCVLMAWTRPVLEVSMNGQEPQPGRD
jgi:transcriptional regulator GlxA family with amidase domain